MKSKLKPFISAFLLSLILFISLPLSAIAGDLETVNFNEKNNIIQLAQVSSYRQYTMLGNWTGSPDCSIKFYEDNGSMVEGICDNGSYAHVFTGKYINDTKIMGATTRIDPAGCKTDVAMDIEFITPDLVIYSQDGWNGCRVETSSGRQVWRRS